MDVTAMSVSQSVEWVANLAGGNGRKPILSEREQMIAHQIIKEIQARLGFLENVGLGYLTIDRPPPP